MSEIVFTIVIGIGLCYLWSYSQRKTYSRARVDHWLFKAITEDITRADFHIDLDGTDFKSEQIQDAFERNKGLCQICNRKTFKGNADTGSFKDFLKTKFKHTVAGHGHHWIPKDLGGRNWPINLGWLCYRCNIRIKNYLTLMSFWVAYKLDKKIYLPKSKDGSWILDSVFKGDRKKVYTILYGIQPRRK